MAAADEEGRSVDEPRADPEPPDPDRPRGDDYLDEQEEESFPASDPHSDWSG